MSHRSWMILAALIGALLLLNAVMGGQAHIFLGRKFADLIEWTAFWR